MHKRLRAGYQESFYANALEIEFKARGIRAVREWKFGVLYRGEKVGEGKIDFLVEDEVILEIKAVERLAPVHTAQVISYLTATGKKLAIILNFQVAMLKDGIRRVAR